jgi:hypothetical protein
MTDQPDQREQRAVNYRVKREHEFRCAECGRAAPCQAVVVKATGELSTRCDPCLDRRTDEVLPHQWADAAEREDAKLAASR